MANTTTKAERQAIDALTRELIEARTANPEQALVDQTGISRERARMAIARVELRMRGERVREAGRPTVNEDGAMVMYAIRVSADLDRFLGKQGTERVREKLTEWMNGK